MTDEEIHDLLDRLRSGEAAARAEMFQYIAARFRPLAHKLLRQDFPRVGLYAETDDILHDALCRLIPYLEQSDRAISSSRGQLHKLTAMVLRHTLLDLVRKLFGSVQGRPMGDGLVASHPDLQESSGLDAWREKIRLHQMIDRLPEPEQTVMEMTIYLELTPGEIARRLGIHPGNVARRLASAKEMLGRMLRADDRRAE